MAGAATRHDGAPPLARGRWMRQAMGVAGVVALLMLVSAAVPEPASAAPFGINVGDIMRKAVKAMFGPAPLGTFALQWLVTVPDYNAGGGILIMPEGATGETGAGAGAGAGGTDVVDRSGVTSKAEGATGETVAEGTELAELQSLTTAIGLAMLAAVVTLAVIGHWAAGFAGGRGNMIQGVAHSAGAGLFILAWPWVYTSGVAASNSVSHLLLGDSVAGIDQFFGTASAGELLGTVGWGLIVVVFVVGPLTLIGLVLLLIKVGLNAGTALVYIAMPITIALWPVPGFAWLTQWALRVAIALMLIPIGWACLVAIATAFGLDTLQFQADAEGGPLAAALVMLGLAALMAKLPGMILRTAGVVSGGSGFMSNLAAFTASHLAFRTIARHVPDALGGSKAELARQKLRFDQGQTQFAQGQARHKAWEESQKANAKTDTNAAQPEARGPRAEAQTTNAGSGAELYTDATRAQVYTDARAQGGYTDSRAHMGLTGMSTVEGVEYSHSRLSPDLQQRVHDAVHRSGSPEETASRLEALHDALPNGPNRDALGDLRRTRHDLVWSGVPRQPLSDGFEGVSSRLAAQPSPGSADPVPAPNPESLLGPTSANPPAAPTSNGSPATTDGTQEPGS